MKFRVDEALCNGHGLCLAVAPTVYDCDDDGFNVAVGVLVDVGTGEEAAARQGAAACPEQAITIFDD